MSFLRSPVAAQTTPEKCPSKSRTAQRRVYGKRKVNAPRVVFEHGSPAKDLRKATTEALGDVEARLAEITIQDEPICAGENVDDGSTAGTAMKCESQVENTHIGLPLSRSSPKTKNPDTKTNIHLKNHVASPTRNKPKPKAPQRMLEVRIPSRVVDAVPRQMHPQNATTVKKRSIRKTPAPRLSSGCINDEKDTAYVRPILNEALSPLAAQGVQKFSSWAARGRNMFEVVKLAEGSYGEVYKLCLREKACKQEMSKSKLARLREYGDGVFKIVPLRAQRGPGSRKFTSINEIVSEAKMLKYLDPIPGFARFRDIHVVQGRFPEPFQAAWDHYKQTKDDCLNPNPASKTAYPDSQMWAIVEMDDAGCELEKFSWSSIVQIYDIFWGVAMGLARAEEYAMFEVST